MVWSLSRCDALGLSWIYCLPKQKYSVISIGGDQLTNNRVHVLIRSKNSLSCAWSLGISGGDCGRCWQCIIKNMKINRTTKNPRFLTEADAMCPGLWRIWGYLSGFYTCWQDHLLLKGLTYLKQGGLVSPKARVIPDRSGILNFSWCFQAILWFLCEPV